MTNTNTHNDNQHGNGDADSDGSGSGGLEWNKSSRDIMDKWKERFNITRRFFISITSTPEN